MTDQVTPQQEARAKDTVKLIYEGKQLTKYVPKGQSPKLYIDLIKAQVMKPDKRGVARSDADLLLFLYVAKRTGLDPLTKQIYAVFRWDSRQGKEVMSIQTGIDGMRLVAQRTGEYAGQDDAVIIPYNEDADHPTKATVTVYKFVGGQRVGFTASARWTEYAQGESPMWKKMPYTMLAKCAEALALRKGFPNELSGIYSEEEMQQAKPDEKAQIAALPKPTPVIGEDKIQVEHGAPSDNSAVPQTAEKLPEKLTPDNIDKFAGKLEDGPDSPETATPPVNLPEPTKTEPASQPPANDPAALREKIKAMGEYAKENPPKE